MSNSNNQVVLHRHGDRDPVSIGTSKCLIRSMIDNQQIDCCAIFSGRSGTAIRSYVSDVLVNGTPASVRSLSVGDEIELPCKTKFEVCASTEIQPVNFNRNQKSAEVNQQPASLVDESNTNNEGPVMTTQNSTEETLLSPFSEDLPQIVAQADVAEPVSNAADSQSGGISQNDLDSMFSGMTTGSTEVAPVAAEPVAVRATCCSSNNCLVTDQQSAKRANSRSAGSRSQRKHRRVQ